MDKGARRLSRAASGIVVVLAMCTVACGPRSSLEDATPTAAATTEPVADAEAVQAAEATLRAFFAVKSRAGDAYGDMIGEQAAYLTARDVHPSVAYEAGMQGRPVGITTTTAAVELSNPRWIDEAILIDFASTTTGVTYPIVGDELQRDEGTPQESHWDGTATLEFRDGEWLIDHLTADSYGSSFG